MKTNIFPLKIDGCKTDKIPFRILVPFQGTCCFFSGGYIFSASPLEAMEIPEVLAAQFELLAEVMNSVGEKKQKLQMSMNYEDHQV